MACATPSTREYAVDNAASKRMRTLFENLGLYGLWVALAAFVALTAFQVHATLIYVAILIVENPTLRPTGWTTGTIHALSRILVLILGGLWLALVVFSEGYLGEGKKRHILRTRVLHLMLFTAALYGISYAVLVLLS